MPLTRSRRRSFSNGDGTQKDGEDWVEFAEISELFQALRLNILNLHNDRMYTLHADLRAEGNYKPTIMAGLSDALRARVESKLEKSEAETLIIGGEPNEFEICRVETHASSVTAGFGLCVASASGSKDTDGKLLEHFKIVFEPDARHKKVVGKMKSIVILLQFFHGTKPLPLSEIMRAVCKVLRQPSPGWKLEECGRADQVGDGSSLAMGSPTTIVHSLAASTQRLRSILGAWLQSPILRRQISDKHQARMWFALLASVFIKLRRC